MATSIFLKTRGFKLPEFVSTFTGYNKPEASKHRKRILQNMSSSVIRAHSSALFNCLQTVYWSKTKFSEFKPCIVQLAESLAGYIT